MNTDFIYVAYEGTLRAMSEVGEVVKSYSRGDSFSEKYMLEDDARAVTVKCSSDCVLFMISEEDFGIVRSV